MQTLCQRGAKGTTDCLLTHNVDKEHDKGDALINDKKAGAGDPGARKFIIDTWKQRKSLLNAALVGIIMIYRRHTARQTLSLRGIISMWRSLSPPYALVHHAYHDDDLDTFVGKYARWFYYYDINIITPSCHP